MFNRRQVLLCGAASVGTILLPKTTTPHDKALSKYDIKMCDHTARILVCNIIGKIIPKNIADKDYEFHIYSDIHMYKVKRVGWYCWVEHNHKYGGGIDIDMDMFESIVTDEGLQTCIATCQPIHETVIFRSKHYWETFANNNYKLERGIC